MNKERGIADLWLVVIGAIVLLGLLTGLVYGVTSYLKGVRAEALQAGKDACDTAYKARDNAALTAALARVKTLEAQARAQEAANVAAMEAARLKLAKEVQNGKATEKRVLADIASGKLRVRGTAFQAGTCPAVGAGSASSETGKPGARDNGASTCKLSDAAASDLLAIGNDADDTARQLAAAQAVILADRVTCNTP